VQDTPCRTTNLMGVALSLTMKHFHSSTISLVVQKTDRSMTQRTLITVSFQFEIVSGNHTQLFRQRGASRPNV
jgi:hypothetical protein